MDQFDSNSYNSLAARLEKSAKTLRSSKTKKVSKGFIQDLLNAVAIIKGMARSAVHANPDEMRFVDDDEDETKATPANVLSKTDSKRITKEANGVGILSVLFLAALAVGLAIAIGYGIQQVLPKHTERAKAHHTSSQSAEPLSFQ